MAVSSARWRAAVALVFVSGLVSGIFGPSATRAEVAERDLAALRSLEQTLGLEREAADAIRGRNNAKLRRLSAEITRTYASALADGPSIDRARNLAKPGSVGPCHAAGLTLRRAVVGFASGRLKPRVRGDLVDAIPPDLTDQFAAHVQRCELIERTEPSVRRIGGTCLIDGKRCRESER